MLVVRIKFIAGRYHATPWGRNVNEGVPEWPPSPYRIIRALVYAWKLKLPDWQEDRVAPILESLASEPPSFYLPPATAFHTEAYLNANEKDRLASNLVYDPFVAVNEDVLVCWEKVNLSSKQEADLSLLLSMVGYLGRSESLVDMNLADTRVQCNCFPYDGNSVEGYEKVLVACAKQPSSFSEEERGKWLDYISWSTYDIRRTKKNEPPALINVPYMRRNNCFEMPASLEAPNAHQAIINGVIYAMDSKVLPDITSTIEVSERVHRKLMGIYKRYTGDPKHISPKFSGKDENGMPLKGHRHIYILPTDDNRDGRLDHLLVICRDALDMKELATLSKLSSIYQPNGLPDIILKPVMWGNSGNLRYTEPSTWFISATPFVSPRHYRKGRGPFESWIISEVKRELKNHGFPMPESIKPLKEPTLKGKTRKWYRFRRSRKGDAEKPGYGFILKFNERVNGPIAIGYGAHFGLGLFLPAEPEAIAYDSLHNGDKIEAPTGSSAASPEGGITGLDQKA